MTRILPYGSWPSPLTPATVAEASVAFGQLAADGDTVWWVEQRPAERGRAVLVRWRPGAAPEDVTPPPWSVRTRVYEYGGGAFAVRDGLVCFTHDADQRVYRLDPGGAPEPITPDGPDRFADGVIDRRRGALIALREDRSGGSEPVHTLVRIPLDGAAPPQAIVAGDDFYAAPRLAPDGSQLAWLAWRHPNMPWDGTELWLAALDGAGRPTRARRVAGGEAESVLQPAWSPDGVLHFVSDASGFWNLYRLGRDGARPLLPRAAEFARPPWTLGGATYGFLPGGAIACAWASQGRWHVGRLDPTDGTLDEVPTGRTDIEAVTVAGTRIVLSGGGPHAPAAIVALDGGAEITLRGSGTVPLEPAGIAVAEAVELPSAAGRSTHARFHRPVHETVAGPADARPPLVVRAHGGPHAAAPRGFDRTVQLYTSRGFAFLDVDYGGSAGYGRAYRQRLYEAWGIVDVEDVVFAARGVAERGWVDPARMVVRGSSAGGFTALCALTFHDAFRAGAVWYGIGDLRALAESTHKFESRYDSRLIGPWPAAADRYRTRSPLYHTDRLDRPVLFLHGLEDRVVPPAQTAAMVTALDVRGIPVAHLEFAGEGHGFRQAETIRRALAAELAFHATVLAIPLADPPDPPRILHWPPAGQPAKLA